MTYHRSTQRKEPRTHREKIKRIFTATVENVCTGNIYFITTDLDVFASVPEDSVAEVFECTSIKTNPDMTVRMNYKRCAFMRCALEVIRIEPVKSLY